MPPEPSAPSAERGPARPHPADVAARPDAPSPRATALLFALAVAAGSVMPLQGRINSRLAHLTGDPVLAALCSFAAGLVVMVLVSVLTPRGRRGLARIRPALAAGSVRPWYAVAGVIGGLLVLTQSATIGPLGVAVFTVAVVTGQVVGGMVVDRLGLSPAGVQRLTPRRLTGAALALAAVALVVWPSLGEAGGGPGWALLALLPLLAGLATAGQQVFNARQTTAYGTAIPATLVNFTAGVLFLGVVWGGIALASGHGMPALPHDWRLYLGGPLGCVFIGVGAMVVPRLGVFAATLGLVSGNLLGSLVVDLVAPTDGSTVTTTTVLGTLGALAAVTLASWPARRR